MKTENIEQKTQYILSEDGSLIEILKTDAVPVEHPIKYKLMNAFEVFVQVRRTQNYWISNYGRCVNNLNHKDKNTFFEHKQGKVHYTVFEVDVDIDGSRWKRETAPEILVAETFLAPCRGRFKIWHKDGDFANNYYKNLIYVSDKEFRDLKAGKIVWESLNLDQEYIEYENKASRVAYSVYNGIKTRCSNTKKKKRDNVGACYDDAIMCQEWLDNQKSFVAWYLANYYEVDDESMAVDKDLFGNGSKVYSPDTCCILPQILNTMLTNCKKHRSPKGKTSKMDLPLGVRYDERLNEYFAEIKPFDYDETITLSYWDTPEEAFAEYKMVKQADILMMATKYKNKIPKHVYEALTKYEVKPFVED